MLYGPIYHRLLHRHAPFTDRFVTEVVDVMFRGLGGVPAVGPSVKCR
jgi:hypothetical protein